MAESDARNDPFIAFRFDLRFDDDSYGGFSECSGLNLETQIQDYLEGGRNDHALKFPTRTVQSDIVLKRGIVNRKLWDWYYGLTQGDVKTRNVTILVYDQDGSSLVMEYRVRNAFPRKWTGPDLNAAQNNVAVETLELCHQGLERRT